jgi:hypothetical protein
MTLSPGALLGERDPSLYWLRKAIREGLPCYPLFARGPHVECSGWRSGARGDARRNALALGELASQAMSRARLG